MIFTTGFVSTIFLILSITPPLRAHNLPIQNISPRANTALSHDSGITFHHHRRNVYVEGSRFQKRARPDIDERYCRLPTHDLVASECLPKRSAKDYMLECFSGMPGRVGPYHIFGKCAESEICVTHRSNFLFASCVSHEDFFHMAQGRAGGNRQFHQALPPPPTNRPHD